MQKTSFLYRTNMFIRSSLFSLFMMSTAIVYSMLCIIAYPLPLHYRFRIVTQWTRMIIGALKVLCYINYRVEGMEHLPKDRNGIILSKHQSTWETFFLPAFFGAPAIIIKKELLWVPFFGWGLATVAPIAIDRANRTSAMEQIIKKGKRYLKEGRWVLVFPEGTRVAPGKIGHYRLGGARLATQTGYPVLPIAHNAGYFWSKRRFIKKPGTVQVVIGPLIETEGRTPEAVLAEAKQWIETTMEKMDRRG